MTNESYDRELIARMLADYATFAKTEFQLGPVWAQIEALRAADRSSYREAEPAAKVIAAEGFYGVGGWVEQPKDARDVKGLKGLRGLPIGTLLYPHPAADALGAVRVTDELVERAAREVWKVDRDHWLGGSAEFLELHPSDYARLLAIARAALEAALGQGKANG